MDASYYYMNFVVPPVAGIIIGVLIMKCCCKRWCMIRSRPHEGQHNNTPIYVIPISVNDNIDEDSVSSVAAFAPPAYDSFSHVITPPPYSERKISIPEEEPPAYSEIVLEPSFLPDLPAHQTHHT